MSQKRRYQLLCPVARALDTVGDRWTLLILRDLHAGPARFQQLQEGLGIATNLLTTRLSELSEAGVIQRTADDRQAPYELTELGRSSDRMLWELVRFGALLDPDPAPKPPGNLRTIALPLRMMLSAVPDRPKMTVHLLVDDEIFVIDVDADTVGVQRYESAEGAPDSTPDLVLRVGYERLLDLSTGRIDLDEFGAHHSEVVAGAENMGAFAIMLATGLRLAAVGES